MLVFGHCHNVAAKGLEQQCNLQQSLVPKRERQRKRGNRERETKRERERESSTGTQQSGDMAAVWLSVIMDELRSSRVPCGAWFDSPSLPSAVLCRLTGRHRGTQIHAHAFTSHVL